MNNKPCTHKIVQEAMKIVSKDVIPPKYVRNMSKIPTAEDLLIEKGILTKPIEESGSFPLNLTRDTHIGTAKEIRKAMIEFAKLHCEAQANIIAEKAKWKCDTKESHFGDMNRGNYDFCDSDSDGDIYQVHFISVDKDSILNSYPLSNIK